MRSIRKMVIFFLILGLPGCGEDLIITANRDISGKLTVNEFVLDSAAVINLVGNLEVTAKGDINISGTIGANNGSGYGVKLVSSQGNIVVSGTILTAAGQRGANESNQVVAQAYNGGNGGSIELIARNGRVQIQGRLEAGDGGVGGSAITNPQNDRHVHAFSGAGGNGGNIRIFSSKGVEVSGEVYSGSGMISGFAQAFNRSQDELAEAKAISRRGGDGGSIIIESGAFITLTASANVISGAGGFTSPAQASGVTAIAQVDAGGDGGNIEIKLPAGQKLIMDGSIVTGEGRNSGGANAKAYVKALAEAGGGGIPGLLLGRATGTRRDAGNSGSSIAILQNQMSKTDPGRDASGVRPGIATYAEQP